jgi:hypothetical protein
MIYPLSNHVWKTTRTGTINTFLVRNKSEAEEFIYPFVLPNDNDSERDKDMAERHDSDLSESITSAFRTKHGVSLTNEMKLFITAPRFMLIPCIVNQF